MRRSPLSRVIKQLLLGLEMQMDHPWVSQNLPPIPAGERAVHFIRKLVKKPKTMYQKRKILVLFYSMGQKLVRQIL